MNRFNWPVMKISSGGTYDKAFFMAALASITPPSPELRFLLPPIMLSNRAIDQLTDVIWKKIILIQLVYELIYGRGGISGNPREKKLILDFGPPLPPQITVIQRLLFHRNYFVKNHHFSSQYSTHHYLGLSEAFLPWTWQVSCNTLEKSHSPSIRAYLDSAGERNPHLPCTLG